MPALPLCPGINCPKKYICQHFKEVIDVIRESHFTHTPYDHNRKRCEHFIGVNGTNHPKIDIIK